MHLDLQGKRALVSGSTKGIGRAIAVALLEEGATVYINGRSAGSVEPVVRALGAHGDARAAPGDIGTADGCRQIHAEASGDGPLDILVNNAGIFEPEPFEEIDDESWERFYRVNVLSGVRLSRAVMGTMRGRGWGRIVFISSESGINTPAEMVHYGMTKTAQLAVARGLARVLSGTGVTVNSVLPGPTWTEGVSEFVEKMARSEGVSVEEMKRKFVPQNRPTSVIQRFAEPEEVAALVAFLCSSRASAITGTAQRVEGGIVNTCF